jgi:hypothetical protein
MNKYKAAGQAKGFYDIPILSSGELKPIYYDLFDWKPMAWYGGVGGELKEELFNTIDKKIAYTQGVFEDQYDGFTKLKGENFLQFANSQQKVERCKRWIDEIAHDKVYNGLWGHGIISHNILYYIPICHTLEINPKTAEFIRNYKFN